MTRMYFMLSCYALLVEVATFWLQHSCIKYCLWGVGLIQLEIVVGFCFGFFLMYREVLLNEG